MNPTSLILLMVFAHGPTLAHSRNLNSTPGFKELLSQNPCASDISKQLESWESLLEWNERPLFDPLQPTRSFLSPTRKIGFWTEVRFDAENRASAMLIQTEKTESIYWRENCQKEIKTTQKSIQPQNNPSGLSDQELNSFLEKNEKGIVFVWSPHMPCSVKGLHAIQKTAEVMQLPLLALLDPASNLAFAKKLARKEKFQESTLRPVRSLELILRGMTNYPPALQVFSQKAFRGPVFRGFQDNTNYQRFIESNL